MGRHRACAACTTAKRRCDRESPTCHRCAEKHIRCDYASRSPRDQQFNICNSERGLQRVTPEEAFALSPPTWLPPTPLTERLERDKTTWFHEPDSWAISPNPQDSPPSFASDLSKNFIGGIRKWLNDWVDYTHCAFIHGRLFQHEGLPSCLQDAYTTLATYRAKNDHNEETIFQIVQTHAASLLLHQSMTDDPALDMALVETKHHLARVQALFIYVFIGLFDGNIRQRTLADAQISTLLLWSDYLWESATLDASSPILDRILEADNAKDPDVEAANVVWPAWVLSESVRRTWLVVKYTITTYFSMRDGKTNCPGAVLFTSRSGLWDCSSGLGWVDELRQWDPQIWTSSCNQGDELISTKAAWEVDDFGKHMFTILWGIERIKRWTMRTQT